MLVLSRKVGQRIWIGDEISVTVVRISGGAIRLGIEAPSHMPVAREELREQTVSKEAVAREAVAVEEVPAALTD